MTSLEQCINCNICRMWLAHCMASPLRCPGLGYNAEKQLITSSGRLWSDIVAEHQAKRIKERDLYWNENKEHLESHGIRYNGE